MNLKAMGWNEYFENQFNMFKQEGLTVGRIIKESRHIYQVFTEEDPIQAKASGYLHYTAVEKSDYPTVGDWVIIRRSEDLGLIERVLRRETFFSRKTAGNETEQQIVASNIDYVCIVAGLDGGRNFSLRGIERYIAMANEGGVKPVIVLNKADLCADREAARLEAETVSGGVPLFMVSALTGESIESFSSAFKTGTTLAFTGPSGVGKSALLNALSGNTIQRTGVQRESDLRGRHTTTHKEMFFLTGGAMVIDTPGMRELQLWGSTESIDTTFSEISEAAGNCRYKNCSHQGEPGCAVQHMLVEGSLDIGRYQNYLDMRSELSYMESRMTEKGRLERKKKEKDLSRRIKNYYREK